jgi:hypothetical protein
MGMNKLYSESFIEIAQEITGREPILSKICNCKETLGDSKAVSAAKWESACLLIDCAMKG